LYAQEDGEESNMRTKIVSLVALIALVLVSADALARGGGSSGHSSSSGSHYVAPHVTKNGTYVQGHYQTNPNSTKSDNWSTKGNVNPYTGETGKASPVSNSNSLSSSPGAESTPTLHLPTPRFGESAPAMAAPPIHAPYTTPHSVGDRRSRDTLDQSTRSRAMRSAFQHLTPCPSTGRTTGACPGYVVDHVVPLCANGADLPSNMQWQSATAAKEKDVLEKRSCASR